MTEQTNSNIISWNIQSTNCSVSGSKFDDPEFCNIFNKSQFICLQEIRQPVTHPGYRVFNNTRKDNRHGGVCIMISNCLARGVSKVQSQLEDVVACKLEKTFFDLEEDLFLVNSYIKPAQTSIKTSGLSGLEILAELDQLLNNLHGKGDDLINNEILKVLSGSENHTLLLVKLFNHCLDSGTYPWNNSIITPLHKKGCKSNPDNYRAVAVSSNIGKLFSTILLNRILQYKSEQNPDPINQLGFSKGAQTYIIGHKYHGLYSHGHMFSRT